MNKRISNLFYNIYTKIYTIFKRRDKQIVVVGSWMGTKFADNSRFLYQFLQLNKEKLNLKRVVWVTRNKKLYDELLKCGYDVLLIGTKESKKIHLKAGIHILCNSVEDFGKFKADIDIKYSFGAKIINLWHGNAIKSIGLASNKKMKSKKNNYIQTKLKNVYYALGLKTIMSVGGYNKQFILCTSKHSLEDSIKIFGYDRSQFLVSSYPRNCECIELLESEKNIIRELKKYKYVILYLPTFRTNCDNYVHPLENSILIDYLKNNQSILWVEKSHTASNYEKKFNTISNIMYLETDFDINTILQRTSMLITDYSSVLFDAVYFNIPLCMYTPDIDYFKNEDVGLMFDIRDYFKELIVEKNELILEKIERAVNNQFVNSSTMKIYNKVRLDFFDNKIADYNSIWNDIKKII